MLALLFHARLGALSLALQGFPQGLPKGRRTEWQHSNTNLGVWLVDYLTTS